MALPSTQHTRFTQARSLTSHWSIWLVLLIALFPILFLRARINDTTIIRCGGPNVKPPYCTTETQDPGPGCFWCGEFGCTPYSGPFCTFLAILPIKELGADGNPFRFNTTAVGLRREDGGEGWRRVAELERKENGPTIYCVEPPGVETEDRSMSICIPVDR